MDIIQQLLKLIKINTKISALASSDEILREIMEEAMSLTGTSAAFVLRVSPRRDVSCAQRYGERTQWSSTSALEAFDARRMVYSTNALQADAAASILAGSIQTLISAPLSAEDDGSMTLLQLAGQDTTSIDPQVISLLSLFVSQVQVTTTRVRLEEAAVRNAALAATGKLAAQVAHDIRSPLAALQAVSSELAKLGPDHRELVEGAMARIREIAGDLLEKDRAARAAEVSRSRLAELIEPLIAEKKLEHRSKKIFITTSLEPGVSARVNGAEFKRVLSNLINNAVEALGQKGGTVKVDVSSRENNVLIAVADDGKGIPPEILAKLGRRGESHGKNGGSGLGLDHARTCAEAWGGALEVSSKVGSGTTATLRLPLAQ